MRVPGSADARRVRALAAIGAVLVLGIAGCRVAVDRDAAMPPNLVTDGADDPRTPPSDTGRSGETGRSGDTATTDPSTLTLAFAGDVHFEGGLADLPQQPGSTLGPMSRTLRDADLAMVNLESALTRGGTPSRKEREDPSARYWFRSPPAALDLLVRSGVDVVSLANNHGADYGLPGVRDTLRIAERSPVGIVGVGRDEVEAFRPFRTSVRGTDVAVLAADASPRESSEPTWAAGPGTGPGLATARVPHVRAIVEAVRAAAAVDDLVVVYLHWGDEGNACPTGSQRALAGTLSAAGADIIVGAHAHVSLGAGLLGATYVSYGLGNFFWYHGRQSETGVLRLTVTDGEVVEEDWRPARIPPEGGAPVPLRGEQGDAGLADWKRLRSCTNLSPAPGSARPSPDPAPVPDRLPAFSSTVRRIGQELRTRMDSSHDPATCPVPLRDLRHLGLTYVGFDGRAHLGGMVVHADVARDVVEVFADLYRARFPIQRMRLVDAYGGDDNRSMAANNTSGYNCRTVAGQTTYSDHAYGRAIDLNPVQNPYVLGERVLPPAGRRFVDVDRRAGARPSPGVIRDGDAVTRAFARHGWGWGGSWSDPDYQHFSTD